MDFLVCELARKGKLLVGEPYFEGGVPVVLDRKGAGEASVGDLVVVKPGRGGPGSSGSSDRQAGSTSSSRAALARGGTPIGRPAAAAARRGAGPGRPAPPLRVHDRPRGAKDFDDALTFRARGRRRARLGAHRRRLRLRARRLALDREAAERSLGLRARPRRPDAALTSSPTTSAACARTRIAAA